MLNYRRKHARECLVWMVNKMTRKEIQEKSEKNKTDKAKRIMRTLELFVDNNGDISDENLARLLSLENIVTSSSTVGRDLTINLKKLFLKENKAKQLDDNLTQEQASVIAFVMQKRKENKHNGQIKGGRVSVINNDIERKENTSQFNGSVRRRG